MTEPRIYRVLDDSKIVRQFSRFYMSPNIMKSRPYLAHEGRQEVRQLRTEGRPGGWPCSKPEDLAPLADWLEAHCQRSEDRPVSDDDVLNLTPEHRQALEVAADTLTARSVLLRPVADAVWHVLGYYYGGSRAPSNATPYGRVRSAKNLAALLDDAACLAPEVAEDLRGIIGEYLEDAA